VGSSSLVYRLKKAADEHPFPVEIKGGSHYIRPKRCVVTCQWDILDFFGNLEKPISDKDFTAINLRFKQIRIINHKIYAPDFVELDG
jgi:hypothetical protein